MHYPKKEINSPIPIFVFTSNTIEEINDLEKDLYDGYVNKTILKNMVKSIVDALSTKSNGQNKNLLNNGGNKEKPKPVVKVNIDDKIVKDMFKMMGKERTIEFLESYILNLDSLLNDMTKYIEEKDEKKLYITVHNLKNKSSLLDVKKLTDMCSKLEGTSNTINPLLVDNKLQELQNEVKILKELLIKYITTV